MKTQGLLLAVALTIPLLAGCAGRDGDGPEEELFTRAIVMDIDPTTLEEPESPEDVLRLAKTTFTYREPEGGLDVEGITVEYTDAAGLTVKRALSSYTDRETLAQGDTVRIAGASPLSDISFTRGENVVAQRTGTHADWLKVDGAPIPLAAAPGARADYKLEASGSLGLTIDRAGTEQEGEEMIVSDVKVDGSFQEKGTFGFSAEQTGGDLRLTMEAKLEATAEQAMSATVEGGPEPGDYGMQFAGSAQLEGKGLLIFGEDRNLRRHGGGGSVTADAVVKLRTPQSGAYEEMPLGEHPLVQETAPYEENDLVPGEGPSADVRRVLERLYAMTLVPGDSVKIMVNVDVPGETTFATSFEYELNVASRQQRQVAGETLDTLRLQGDMRYAFSLDGQAERVFAMAYAYHVEEHSMLPVDFDSEFAQSYTDEDLRQLFELAREQAPGLVLPEDLQARFEASVDVDLTAWDPGFRTAAAGHGLGIAFPTIVAAAMVFGIVGSASGSEEHGHGHMEEAPALSLARQDSSLTVVSAEAGVAWSDLALSASHTVAYALNEPATADSLDTDSGFPVAFDGTATAGDVLDLCLLADAGGAIMVRLIHVPTNTLLFTAEVDAMRPCEA